MQLLSPDEETAARAKQSSAAGYASGAVKAAASVDVDDHNKGPVALMPVNVTAGVDQKEQVSADDIPPQPRAAVTTARKQFLVEQ